MKKLLVISHERSGTHFLMDTLALNFGYCSKPWYDIDPDNIKNPYYAENIKSALADFVGKGCNVIFKTHYPADFFNDIKDFILKEFTIIYIYRSVDDCLKSLQKHLEVLPWKAGPEVKDPHAFAFCPPSGGLLRYQMRQHGSLLERHYAHHKGYAPWFPEITHITYDFLDQAFEEAVRFIAESAGLDLLQDLPVRPERNDINERFKK